MSLVYLATPYSHSDPLVRQKRFDTVNEKAAELICNYNMHIFSPISHSHPIALIACLPTDWKYWENYCRLMLGACSMLIVLRQEGWETSVGVKAEIEIAKEMGLPIEYTDPTEDD